MEKEKLIIIIEKSSDFYSAYADNCHGIYGAGNSVDAVKKDVIKGLCLFINTTPELPELLKKDYEIEYHFDIPSFLAYYSGVFTKSALERITGINQKQLFHYASGLRKPSEKTIQKLDKALHKFTEELSQIRLT